MKTNIHPEYVDTKFICSCGAQFQAGSTIKGEQFKMEICSNCHPFYTGQQKLVDTAGRVEKFRAKLEKAKKAQTKAESEVVEVPKKKITKTLKGEKAKKVKVVSKKKTAKSKE